MKPKVYLLVLAFLCLLPRSGWAQAQQQGICAEIKIVIAQKLTLERIGFLATLSIRDNDTTDPITDFSANLTFQNPAISATNDSSDLFFVQPPTLENISSVNGSGVIQPGETATISWFIIPAVSAGGTTPIGIQYNVGATLGGQVRGQPIPASALLVVPATITVQPDAQLVITYFTPRDTIGMDPFTGLGSPIPFTFGVLVQNVGYGPANNVTIASQQPQIVQNNEDLLIVAQLLGSRVNDSPLSNANLTVNLGNLSAATALNGIQPKSVRLGPHPAPGTTAKGAWDMITTLSGTFLATSATYTHSTALGGQETSLIKSINAYLFLHEVLDDSPGRDHVRDFLTDTSGALDSKNNLIPDSLYESEGFVYPVNYLTNTVITNAGGLTYQLNLMADFGGWGYLRVTDPRQAATPVFNVQRSDGKVLNTNNYWTSIHYDPLTNFKETYLHIFDLVNLGNYSYSIIYANPPPDTNPPVTTLLFAGPVLTNNGVYYITPETQMYFVSQARSIVTIYDSLGGANGPFQVAFPFNLGNPGTYTLSYYASNQFGIRETNQAATLVVAGGDSLSFAGSSVSSQPFFNPGNAMTIRPGSTQIAFQAAPNSTPLNAQLDIFQGVVGWVTVSNVPSSPTTSTMVSLVVGGANVDFYTYQLNGQAWSPEQAVGAPIALSGLLPGVNTLSVLGRSQYGAYLEVSNAVTASWEIDPTAPATTITGAPANPTLSALANLTVGGVGVTDYRWTLNGSYFQAPTSVTNPIILSNLNIGPEVLAVLGGTNGIAQATNTPTTVTWTLNPLYGYDMSSLVRVRSVTFSNLSGPVSFNWNGESDAGVIQPPGWYTVRVTLTDTLGHTNFTTGLAQIGALAGTNLILADVNRGPQNPYARGRWAVWQDQSDGNWQIYAQDLTQNNAPIVKVTNTPLSQQNPKTDGRYVVWQARRADGDWDIYYADLTGTNGPQAVTSTPNLDEINPSIDWPWVVCQVRPTGATTAPWQIYAYNLVSSLQSLAVSPSAQNELVPAVQAGRVVWQDQRNPNAPVGQIDFYDLEQNIFRQLSGSTAGQLNPAIYDNWIVWSDARNTNLNIYGYDLLRNQELRITSAAENETQPYLNGPWLVCEQDSLGTQTGNAHIIHLPSLAVVPVTATPTLKSYPSLADGWAVWQETSSNQTKIVTAKLPSLQAVFQNRNLVAVTEGMAAYAGDAYGLLALWSSNGVQAITQYASLVPHVTSETVVWTDGAPAGPDFTLVSGSYLWVEFNRQMVLDLGTLSGSSLNLGTGANVFGYSGFPDAYSAFQLLRQLGFNNAAAVRMLDAQSGRWRVAEVQAGAPIGDDFPIPNVAVIMVNLVNPVSQFTPRSE